MKSKDNEDVVLYEDDYHKNTVFPREKYDSLLRNDFPKLRKRKFIFDHSVDDQEENSTNRCSLGLLGSFDDGINHNEDDASDAIHEEKFASKRELPHKISNSVSVNNKPSSTYRPSHWGKANNVISHRRDNIKQESNRSVIDARNFGPNISSESQNRQISGKISSFSFMKTGFRCDRSEKKSISNSKISFAPSWVSNNNRTRSIQSLKDQDIIQDKFNQEESIDGMESSPNVWKDTKSVQLSRAKYDTPPSSSKKLSRSYTNTNHKNIGSLSSQLYKVYRKLDTQETIFYEDALVLRDPMNPRHRFEYYIDGVIFSDVVVSSPFRALVLQIISVTENEKLKTLSDETMDRKEKEKHCSFRVEELVNSFTLAFMKADVCYGHNRSLSKHEKIRIYDPHWLPCQHASSDSLIQLLSKLDDCFALQLEQSQPATSMSSHSVLQIKSLLVGVNLWENISDNRL